MYSELDLLLSMQDDDFQNILKNDPVIDELEKQKYNENFQFNELMAILSKIYKINGVLVQAVTPAIWAFLYSIGNAYTRKGKTIENIDTDIFMYIISNGISNLPDDLILTASGFCIEKGIDYAQTENDIKTFIYLMFRPLEMLNTFTPENEQIRFNADWLTKIVAIVCPLTNKTSDDVIFNMALTECFYYLIQYARKFDDKGLIKRKNSDEIEAEIFKRTIDLGKEYYQKNYKTKG